MNISVLDIIKSDLATNLTDSVALFDVIKTKRPSEIIISFEGIRLISTLFLNESLGRYVIENALLGDDYDNLVDNALLSM